MAPHRVTPKFNTQYIPNSFSVIFQAMLTLPPDVSIWTVLAVFAATVSAISAYRSSRFAKRVLKISEQTFRDRQSNFDLYLIDSQRFTTKISKERKILSFHLTISNKSDTKNSFKADLEVEYTRPDNSVGRAITGHDNKLEELIENRLPFIFQNNIRIDERDVQSKWLIFEQPSVICKEYRINKYSIKITDIHNNMQTINSTIIKDSYNVE